MKITLPVVLNPISRRKDRSVLLKFDTRELIPSEVLTLMSMEGAEGWLLFASQEAEIDDRSLPNDKADIGLKSPSERLRNVIFAWYRQSVDDGVFIGDYDTFYKAKIETIIESIKSKLHG